MAPHPLVQLTFVSPILRNLQMRYELHRCHPLRVPELWLSPSRRVYLVLHHVLKELASKRLPMDQRNFAEVST